MEIIEMTRDENDIISDALEIKILEKLNEYLEFDSNELFRNKSNLIRVFGGAIRDAISDQKIHDIDILCSSRAHRYLEYVLENKGYVYMESLQPKDLSSIYHDIHVINEPHTWMKGTKIVQLIRPAMKSIPNYGDKNLYKQGFQDLIANVDISCCGLSYDGERLYEDFPGAVSHAQMKVFSVNKRAAMYSERRIIDRRQKMLDRGWKEIESGLSMNREIKIANVLGYKLL